MLIDGWPSKIDGTVKNVRKRHEFHMLWTRFSKSECFGPNSYFGHMFRTKFTFTLLNNVISKINFTLTIYTKHRFYTSVVNLHTLQLVRQAIRNSIYFLIELMIHLFDIEISFSSFSITGSTPFDQNTIW